MRASLFGRVSNTHTGSDFIGKETRLDKYYNVQFSAIDGFVG